jgi:hypothetical protein
MNKQRRKAIAEAISAIEELVTDIENLRDEEQEYHDNMPENMQQGEKGEAAEAAVDALGNAAQLLDEAKDALGEIE